MVPGKRLALIEIRIYGFDRCCGHKSDYKAISLTKTKYGRSKTLMPNACIYDRFCRPDCVLNACLAIVWRVSTNNIITTTTAKTATTTVKATEVLVDFKLRTQNHILLVASKYLSLLDSTRFVCGCDQLLVSLFAMASSTCYRLRSFFPRRLLFVCRWSWVGKRNRRAKCYFKAYSSSRNETE